MSPDEKCKIDKVFEGLLTQKITGNTELVKVVHTIYQFNVNKNGKLASTWSM